MILASRTATCEENDDALLGESADAKRRPTRQRRVKIDREELLVEHRRGVGGDLLVVVGIMVRLEGVEGLYGRANALRG